MLAAWKAVIREGLLSKCSGTTSMPCADSSCRASLLGSS
jgi:hypothetical protein